MNWKLTCWMIAGLFLFATQAYSTHNRSGEITFRQTGALTIEATVTTFTKASSRPADRDTLTICWGDGLCERIPRTNGPGDPPQGETLPGDYKYNVYIGAHTYEQVGTYLLSMTDPNRNALILNVNYPNSDQVRFYLESMVTVLEDFSAGNHSPVLLVPPVTIGLLGQPFEHIIHAFDMDGDSLAFELAVPLEESGQPVPNYLQLTDIEPGPDNQLSFVGELGFLQWDSPQRAGEYNIAILARSYRNGQLMDEVMRDMQILIVDGENVPPDIMASVPGNEVIGLAVGDTVQVAVQASSPIEGQEVRLSATSGLFEDIFEFPAVFTATSSGSTAEGVFSWVVREEQARQQPYLVVFQATDDFQEAGLATFLVLQYQVSSVSSTLGSRGSGPAIRIYPNPVTDVLQVSVDQLSSSLPYVLFSQTGQAVAAGQIRAPREELQLADLPAGLYFLQVGIGRQVKMLPVVKQ